MAEVALNIALSAVPELSLSGAIVRHKFYLIRLYLLLNVITLDYSQDFVRFNDSTSSNIYNIFSRCEIKAIVALKNSRQLKNKG